MAGMTREGLTVKKQGEVIQDLKSGAVPIFQDLVPEGDVLDTSDDSTLGRLIGLNSLPLADLWQLAQSIYWAFDPNSATGIALDNLVQYAGITRRPETFTVAEIVVWGDDGTSIFADLNSVRATDNTLYDVVNTITLDRSRCIGADLVIPEVVEGEEYTVSIATANISVSVGYVAQEGDSPLNVYENLKSQLNAQTFINTVADDNFLRIEATDIYTYLNIQVGNINVSKIKSRGSVRNQERGVKNQEKNTINQIATPVIGWDSVNNPFPAVSGNDRETDEELRIRFRDSKFYRAQNISDSLYSAIMGIDGVLYAAVYENETDVYDYVYELNPHSFKVVVQGGNPVEIAQAIWLNKPLGIGAEGVEEESIVDSQGFSRIIKYDRPNFVEIYIDIEITTLNDWAATGIEDIKAALIKYFKENISIGDEVIYSRLYTPINSVKGHQVDHLHIGLEPHPTGYHNIPVAYDEVASLSSANITITVN